MRKSLSFGLVGALLLSGCAMIPKYERPDTSFASKT